MNRLELRSLCVVTPDYTLTYPLRFPTGGWAVGRRIRRAATSAAAGNPGLINMANDDECATEANLFKLLFQQPAEEEL